jgi:PKD repeat protein
MKQNKIGAVLIGLMFLLSLVAVAVPANATALHMVNVVPNTGSEKADFVNILDASGNVIMGLATDVSTGGAWFSLLHGTYTAQALQGGFVQSTTSAFTVDDTSTTTIIYTISDNHAPVAAFVFTASGAAVSFNASGTTDADSDVLTYAWNFGDGSTAGSGVTTSHTYAATGSYAVTLTVNDGKGGVNTISKDVAVQVLTLGALYVRDINYKHDKIAPGSDVKFDLELRNNATYDMENVLATIVIDGIATDGDDLETEVDFGNIDAGDREEHSTTITMPQDAEDKSYTVKVKLEWENHDGDKFSDDITAADKISIVKVKHQIGLTSVQTDETKYNPGDTVQIAVNMLNSGANDETVQIKVASDIGVTATSAAVKLKEGDVTTQYLTFAIPEDAKPGKYFAIVSAAYSGASVAKTIVLEIAGKEQPTIVTVVDKPVQPDNKLANIPATEIALAVVIILLIGAIGWMAKDLIMPPRAKPIVVKAKRA